MLICVALGNVVVTHGLRFRLCAGCGEGAMGISVVIGSMSGETEV